MVILVLGGRKPNVNDKKPQAETAAFAAQDADSPADATPPSLPARIGRYKVERLLGQGGFGLVYLAHDDQLQRLVAIKVPHRNLVDRPEAAEAYLTEARTVANLDHSNIVPVHDVGGTEDCPCYIVSKYIDGTDLARRLKQSRLSIHESVALVATVAEALHYAHKQGLVHRDIKPGNILLDRSGKPFVADFGLALRDQDVGRGPRYAGTPPYMSPEQARGEGHRVDGRSDIFCLGVVFYELLVGRRPFTGNTQEELLEQVTTFDPRPPRQYDDDLPKELERICLKALAKRAADRHTTAFDLVDDLRHWLSGQAVSQQSDVVAKRTSVAAITPVALPPSPSVASGPSSPATPTSDSQPIKIVPKGLRSFDEHDADFFLELLPGPRDRDGLPDSLRFWKIKIEEADTDKTFLVALIYGPSGCGKSSLIKAGLLPRLSEHVIVVYLEATAAETELRLLHGLRKRCPALPCNLNLKDTLAVLRRGQGIPAGKKVLIVLDQFEQWLHAKKHEENTDLVQALRQCDGVHLQCVVMVRDDFWMSATRFMRELEIRLVDGQNSAAVDLFPVRHSKKVLAAFGRAFGAFPDNFTDASDEQKQFLEQAVSGLAQENKVISVRLALFAEMMKSKSWTPATLKEVGGTQGVGVTFLEETFSAATAPPEHRLHQKAARAVLRALLPESGTDIKGHMRSYAELLEASGYGSRPKDFDDLIRILDSEIRLITPTDPEGKEATEPSTQIQAGGKYYQLTHDYLVHSLRDWLSRKQRETRRGRAELRLAERSAAWNAKPDNRFLPSWWEWPNILLFTQRGKWTAPERRVMRAAGKYHGLILSVTVAVVAVAGLIAFDTLRRVELQRAADLAEAERTRAADLARNVFTATADGVPYALRDLRPLGRLAVGSLREHVENETADFVQRLHAAYALADAGLPPQEFLLGAISIAPASESQNMFAALTHIKANLLPTLSRMAESATEPAHKARYAIVALHLGDSQPAQNLLDFREDPIYRTTLIHTYASWHGDLSTAEELLAMRQDAAFRSGLCAALGAIAPELLQPAERDAATRAFVELFHKAPDGATHSSAGWALRQWKRDLPAIAPESRPSSDRHWFVNREGMTMVEVAPHKFTMGTAGKWGNDFDKSAHEVTLSHAFYLGDREVTIEQFRRCVDDSRNQDSDEFHEWLERYEQYGRFSPVLDCPAVSMTWFEALLYCNWLSVREGRRPCYTPLGEKKIIKWANEDFYLDEWHCDFTADGYRLPTEAEWECAARAGSNGDFCFGSDEDLLPQYAWFIVNGKSRTWPGGAKLPNAWGLFDVHGNVWEWCWDWMGVYSAGSATAPTGPTEGLGRVVRGGSFNHSATDCRTANRVEYVPAFRSIFYGFRVVCGR